MSDDARNTILKHMYDAFSSIERPIPLATYEGSHCNEEVDVFNKTDWESATYSDYLEGMEGAIICPAKTRVWLLPRLFKMVMLRRSETTDDAVDNLSTELETWPIDDSVERLLNNAQKATIVAAWNYLDEYIYFPSGSHIGRELAKRWAVETANER